MPAPTNHAVYYSENIDDQPNTRERIEVAASNWKKHKDITSWTLERKIKSIGGANLHEGAEFDNLLELFKEISNENPAENDCMQGKVLPGIEKLARELQPDENFRLMRAGQEGTLELTKLQIAQILANCFFCNFKVNIDFPNVIFEKLFSTYGSDIQLCKPRREKLKCLLAYFKSVTADPSLITGNVTIERVCVGDASFNRKSLHTILSKISIVETGSPLDCPSDATYVELSNRYIGGGVLGNGCGQEEIKFVTCPDLLAALFFTEPLQDNEALIITGAKPYSTGKGCGKNFEFVVEADANAPSSEVIIAIDNIDFGMLDKGHYTQQYIEREILKAYAIFKKCSSSKITTGNWGGDTLLGDCHLKLMLQWIAASLAQKELVYYCVGNSTCANELKSVLEKFTSTCAGKLYDQLVEEKEKEGAREASPTDAEVDEFDFIRNVTKRDDVDLKSAQTLIEAKPNAGNFIKLMEAHAEDLFGFSLYNLLTEMEMQHLKREQLYKSIATCILECASSIRNTDVKTQLLAACISFKKEKTCSLTRRQIACLLANVFLGTFKPANPNQPNISLTTFFKFNSKRDENYVTKLFSLMGYFWEIVTIGHSTNPDKLDQQLVQFSLQKIEPSALPVKERHITFPDVKGHFTVCPTKAVIGGKALKPSEMGDEERMFLAHPEMIAARIFFLEPLQPDEALLIQNAKNFNIQMLHGTFYEDFAEHIRHKSSAFALIKESSIDIKRPQSVQY